MVFSFTGVKYVRPAKKPNIDVTAATWAYFKLRNWSHSTVTTTFCNATTDPMPNMNNMKKNNTANTCAEFFFLEEIKYILIRMLCFFFWIAVYLWQKLKFTYCIRITNEGQARSAFNHFWYVIDFHIVCQIAQNSENCDSRH